MACEIGGCTKPERYLATLFVDQSPLGGRKVDRFEYLKPFRPQPAGRRQISARRNYSTLLVFGKPA